MARMKALRAHEPGGPEAPVYEETAVPVPARGEVLVAPHAAAITFAEVTWDETWSHLPTTLRTSSPEWAPLSAKA